MKKIKSMSKRDLALTGLAGVVVLGLLWYGVMSKGADTKKELESEVPQIAMEEKVDELLYVFAGPTWIWHETRMNDGRVILPNKLGMFTITFNSAEGAVVGTTDCNNFSGLYTSGAGRTLSFGPLASTRMFCEGSQEVEFAGMVAGSSRYFFSEAGDLVLVLDSEAGHVTLKRQ